MPLVPGNTLENIRLPENDHRDRQYALGGVYIARHSQILLALYDGEITKRVGGTSYTVQFALEGEFEDKSLQKILEQVPEPYKPRLSPLYPPETGPVYRIPVTRKNKASQESQKETASLERLYNKAFAGKRHEAENYYHRIYKLMDDFNRESFLVDNDSDVRVAVGLSEELLVPESQLSRDSDLTSVLKMRRDFAIADALSLFYQKKTFRVIRLLCTLVFLSAFFFEVYTHFLQKSAIAWPLAANILLLITAGLIYLRAESKEFQNKFQDYRALAEGMRVQFFWRLWGLNNSAADHYLRKQMSELEWISNAIRNWNISLISPWKTSKQLTKSNWIDNQVNYFENAAGLNRSRLLRNEMASAVSFVIFSCVLLYLLLHNVLEKEVDLWFQVFGGCIFIAMAAYTCRQFWQEVRYFTEEKEILREEAHGSEIREIQYAAFWRKLISGISFRVLLACFVPAVVVYICAKYFAGNFLLDNNAERLSHGIFILLLLLSALIGGLHHFVAYKMAWEEHVKQYKRMILLFKNASERSEILGDQEILDLGREALAENGDWVLLHRERPLEIPQH
jgi:hypothetical protein